MIVNTNSLAVSQHDYGAEDSPPMQQQQQLQQQQQQQQQHYTSDGQYPCQAYPDDSYPRQYPAQHYVTGTSSSAGDFCDTWSGSHRFFVSSDVHVHTTTPAALAARVGDTLLRPQRTATPPADVSFFTNGHPHHHHPTPNPYYPSMTSHVDVTFGTPHEMTSCQRDPHAGGMAMTDATAEQLSRSSGTGPKMVEDKNRLPDPTRAGATERERTRMHMLNDAFDDLRKVSWRLPLLTLFPDVSSPSDNRTGWLGVKH